MNGLLLPIKAPLMSAGDTGFGELRHTGNVPSRSFVIGILAAAMGIERGNTGLLRLHRGLKVHVLEVKKPRVARDYHIIQAAPVEEEDLVWQKRARTNINPTVTERFYLEDSAFVGCVTGDTELLGDAENALLRPEFVTYLGRRSCPPTIPLIGKRFEKEHPLDAMLGFARTFFPVEFDHAVSSPRLGSRELWWDGDAPPAPGDCMAGFEHVSSRWRRDLLVELPRYFHERPVQVLRISPENQIENNPHPNDDYFDNIP